MTVRLLQKKTAYTVDYPEAIIALESQLENHWTAKEIEIEKDLHDLKTNFTESETHGVVTTLKLFTKYELIVGDEYWSNIIGNLFQRPADIQRMANCFSFYELNVHAPFYAKLNEVLGLDTDEFYNSYTQDPVLRDRMKWIGKQLDLINFDAYEYHKILRSIGTFSMIEGAVLYSSFAFLKHFQSEGKNKLINVTAGINFSVQDENLHAEAGAWLFKTLYKEIKKSGDTSVQHYKLKKALVDTAHKVYEHECRIIDMIFEKGTIKGITDLQLKNFVQSRLDICLENLGFEKEFKPTYNPIAKWFYKNISSSKLHDFFYKGGNEYTRDWVETNFIW